MNSVLPVRLVLLGCFEGNQTKSGKKTKASFHLSVKTNINIEAREHNPEK